MNIALVNELKVVYEAMGIDIWEVITAAKTKPFGFMPFYPGPGLGGHCIPIDPFYFTWKAREYGQHTRFIELAGEINTKMPEHVVHRVADALNSQRKALNGSKMLIVGLAYKPNVDDERESPSYVLMELLTERGAEVQYHDPYVPVIKPTREHPQFAGKKSVGWNQDNIESFDLVLIATNHSCVNYQELGEWAQCIVDTRNAMAAVKELRVRSGKRRARRTEDGRRRTESKQTGNGQQRQDAELSKFRSLACLRVKIWRDRESRKMSDFRFQLSVVSSLWSVVRCRVLCRPSGS